MNKTSQYQFTIIVPIYNEEDNIATLEEKIGAYLTHCAYKACALFVNDGSSDSSLAGIKEICQRNSNFYYLSFAQNRGLSAAIKAGIDEAESTYVGYIDADLQTCPEDFDLLLAHIEQHTLVTGIRVNRKDSGFKKLQSRIANGFRRWMTHDGMQDTGCPLKVMHTDAAKRIPFFTGMHRFLPALILLQEGGCVKQIPVRHYPRMAGVSKFHLWNRLISPFLDCFAYRWMKKRYINYRINDQNILA